MLIWCFMLFKVKKRKTKSDTNRKKDKSEGCNELFYQKIYVKTISS